MILDANGRPATYRDRQFSQHDAELLRNHKKTFLERHGYKERLWCARCEDAGLSPGLRAIVTDSKIDFECRCTVRRYRGQTY